MSRAARSLLTAAVILPLLLLTACPEAPASDVTSPSPTPTAPLAATATPLTPIPAPIDTLAPAPTDTPTRAPTATPTPAPSPAVAALALIIAGDTTWQNLFDNFTTTEQSCIRSDLGDELLAATLGQPVMSDAVADPTVAQILSCLAPELASAIFASASIAGMEQDMQMELSEEQVSCLHDWARGTDVVELVAPPDDSGLGSVISGFVTCIPDLFLTIIIEEIGLTMDDLTGEETACLRQWAADSDWASLFDGPAGYDAAIAETAADWLGCIPDQFIAAVIEESGLASDDLTEEQVSCLRQWAATVDLGSIVGESDPSDVAIAELASQWIACVPDLFLSAMLAEYELAMDDLTEEQASCLRQWAADIDPTTLMDIPDSAALQFPLGVLDCLPDLAQEVAPYAGPDDHADSHYEATPVIVGESVEGTIEYSADIDFFVFEAEQGKLYEVALVLGTLSDSWLVLYDEYGEWLAEDVDQEDSQAPRITWEATESGIYYIEVFAVETGAYTLTITAP